jgi:hypothetical protein
MASLTTLNLSLTDSNATFLSYAPLGSTNGDAKTNTQGFINYLKRLLHGDSAGSLSFYTGAAKGTAVLTVTGAAVADETLVVCGVTFTAKAAGATGNQFNLNATPTTQATNMVTAFNASSDLTGIVTASNVAGVITLTAAVAGKLGNALVVTEGLTNTALTTTFAAAATGSNGTIYTVDLT